jgi:F-type H+-transporting ATPase subunit b
MAEHVTTAGKTPGEGVTGVDHGGGDPEPSVFGLEAPWFVAAAMLAVIGIILWRRVPSAIGRLLDRRIDAIRARLTEAARLRAEAEALRDEFRAKARAADAERQTLLDRAHHEAQAIVEQAKANTAALVERRSRMAEQKIAAAERQAVNEVRAYAAGAAAAAAAQLIAEELLPDADKAIIDRAIADLGKP